MRYARLIPSVCLILLISAPPVLAESSPPAGPPPTTLVLQCGHPTDNAAMPASSAAASSAAAAPSYGNHSTVPGTPVPEPSTWLLLGAGLLGVLGATRRKRGEYDAE